MQNTTADYKLEINKPSRSFECKIVIGDNIYNNEDLVNLILEHTQPQDGFSIGNTISQSLDLTLLNRGDIIFSTSQIKVEIGLKIDNKIEYVLMGIFNIDNIEKSDYTTKITAYDNMIKFETTYYSSLGDKPTLQQVVNELSEKTGVEFTGSLPAYTVSKLEGFTCREVLSYVASICGGNAFITRDGKFTIKNLNEVEKSIDGNNYFDYKREEIKYKIGQVSCQVGEKNILSKGSLGTDSMELQFENPWVTETILTEIYNKLKGLSYLGYSMKWQGDLSLDPYDIITVTDVKNVVRKIPILSQKLSYTGGLTSEIGAKGETKNKNSFSSSGSISNKVNRTVIEQAMIKDALIEKANIKDLQAVSIRTQNLEAKTAKIEEAIIGVVHVTDLNAINANIENLIAADATISNALIGKADITELNSVKGTINALESDTANIKNLLAGNISGESGQLIHLTASNVVIADAVIKDLIASNISVQDLKAGTISTNKFRIVSDSGKMLIYDNTIQISDNNRVRVQIGKDAANDYNMYVWDSTGKLMFDATGLKADGIKNKIIRDDMISDNANIDGAKLNINSLITEINKDTNTSVIKSTKVQIDSLNQTLDVAFNSLKSNVKDNYSKIENNSTTINVMQNEIATAINNTKIVKDGQTILLKDDYNRTVSKVDSINSTIGTHTTKLDQLTGNITNVDTKVNNVQRDLDGTKSTVSSHTSQISGLNSTVNTQGSSINQLKNQIALKVEQTDINNAINNLKVGGRNLLSINNVVNRDSINFVKNKYSITLTHNTAYQGVQFYNLVDIMELNKLYILQYKIRKISGSLKGIAQHIDPQFTVVGYTVDGISRNATSNVADMGIDDGDWHVCIMELKRTVDIVGNGTGSTNRIIPQPNRGLTTSVSVEMKDFQIEKGNKLTDWTPAPEDIDSSISNVQTQVTTTNDKVATIETNLNSITQRVSSTETTTTQLNTKVNNSIKKVDVYYAISDSATVAPTSGWNTNPPTWVNGKYIWSKTTTILTNGTSTTTTPVCITGAKGSTGSNGAAGKGVKSIVEQYYLSTSNTTQSGGSWVTTPPAWANGKYMWTRSVITYTDNSTTTTNPVCVSGSKGDKGATGATGQGVQSITEEYYLSTSKTSQTGGSWTTTPPAWSKGKYIWTRSKIVYKNPAATAYTTPVCDSSWEAANDVDVKVENTKKQVATLETNLNNITQKVTATESKITTINGNITNITNRVTTAESKLTATSLTTTISSAISGGSASISTTQFVMDKSGFTVKNGAIKIQNKAGTTVLQGDTNGNLTLKGTVKSENGERHVAVDSGGILFKDNHKQEQLLNIAMTYFSTNRDINGVTFALAKYGDYIRFSHVAKEDLNTGWNSDDKRYNFFDCWSSDQKLGNYQYKKGINVYSPMYLGSDLLFNHSDNNIPSEICKMQWNGVTNLLGVHGDNGTIIGYKNGTNYGTRIIVTEAAHPGTGDHIRSWGNWNCSGSTVHNATFSGRFVNSYSNNLTRTFAETHCIEAESKQIRINFKNVQIKNGKTILNIPNKYVGMNNEYIISSIVKKGQGDVWVSKEEETRFILESNKDIKINVEVIITLNEDASYNFIGCDVSQLCINETGETVNN